MKFKVSTAFVLLIALLNIGVLSVFAQEPVAPVPANAFDPNVDLSNGFFVEEISDGLYWVTEGSYQILFLTTGEGVIVVDAPPSMSGVTLDAIASVTDEPITHVIYSHSHADHIAGAGIYPEDATYIAHEDTLSQLESGFSAISGIPFGTFVGGGEVPLPTETFSDSYTLEVGNQVLELEYRGVVHEPGNIFVYAPQQKVLMLVDVIFPGWTPFSQLALAEDVPLYYAAHQFVLDYDFDVFVGGHLTRVGNREDVETQQAYMVDILQNSAAAFQQVDFFAVAEETGFENQWLLFDTYLDRVAQHCTDATIPNWVDTLGGVDIFTYSHCWTVMESLRID
jgi:glyoxylase-like metal-dependent hydrolase (beta-lactamase superfamily II)